MQREITKYYSYVYRITNIKENKHYYGSRVCKMDKRFSFTPLEDLREYKSSSTNKEFIKLLEENIEDFKFKIVRICKTKNEAIEYEAILHKKFNVKDNDNFYNLSNQLKTAFDYQERLVCKHCGKSINASNINRFHNDNCLENPNIPIEVIKENRKFKKKRKKVDKKTKEKISKVTKGRKVFINTVTNNKILYVPENLQKGINNKFTDVDDLNIENWVLKPNKPPKRYCTKKYIKPKSSITNKKRYYVYNKIDNTLVKVLIAVTKENVYTKYSARLFLIIVVPYLTKQKEIEDIISKKKTNNKQSINFQKYFIFDNNFNFKYKNDKSINKFLKEHTLPFSLVQSAKELYQLSGIHAEMFKGWCAIKIPLEMLNCEDDKILSYCLSFKDNIISNTIIRKQENLKNLKHSKKYPIIKIYDNNKILKYTCENITFKTFCINNKLPFEPFVDSYLNKEPIRYNINNKTAFKRLTNNGNIRYNGWVAVKE